MQIKLNKVTTFGKYKGRTGKWIADNDAGYLAYMYRKDNGLISTNLRDYVINTQGVCDPDDGHEFDERDTWVQDMYC